MKKATNKESPVDVDVTVGTKDERVVLSFDKKVSWIAMEPAHAIKIAEKLKELAIAILRREP